MLTVCLLQTGIDKLVDFSCQTTDLGLIDFSCKYFSLDRSLNVQNGD